MMGTKGQKILNSCRKGSDEYKGVLALQEARDKYSGLEYLCYLLNNPQFDEKGNLRPQSEVVKRIVEAMSTQNLSRLGWLENPELESLKGPGFDPSSDSPLSLLNQTAKESPFILRVVGKKKGKRIEIESRYEDYFKYSPISGVIQLLSEYLMNKGWKRLKQCPQCSQWFVDRTRKNNKIRCSARCTSQWWSWGRRREANHKVPVKKKRRGRRRIF